MGHLQSRPGRWSLFINQPCMCVCSLSENMLCYFPPSRRAGQMGPPSRPLCIYTAQILLVLDMEITVSGSDGRTSGQTAAFSADSHNVMCAADSEVPYSSPRVAYPPLQGGILLLLLLSVPLLTFPLSGFWGGVPLSP